MAPLAPPPPDQLLMQFLFLDLFVSDTDACTIPFSGWLTHGVVSSDLQDSDNKLHGKEDKVVNCKGTKEDCHIKQRFKVVFYAALVGHSPVSGGTTLFLHPFSYGPFHTY